MNNDHRWIRRIKKNGNEEAANALVSKYYKEMYAFMYKQTLNQELSLDLTQELFISVLKSIRNYDSKKASFRTWLYKLASNRLVDYFRSKNYKDTQLIQSIEQYDFVDDYDMTISLEYKEDFERATTLINTLDASSQQIVRLKTFGDYTFQEIAQIEAMPQSTVKTKYYVALKRIRKGMEQMRDE